MKKLKKLLRLLPAYKKTSVLLLFGILDTQASEVRTWCCHPVVQEVTEELKRVFTGITETSCAEFTTISFFP